MIIFGACLAARPNYLPQQKSAFLEALILQCARSEMSAANRFSLSALIEKNTSITSAAGARRFSVTRRKLWLMRCAMRLRAD